MDPDRTQIRHDQSPRGPAGNCNFGVFVCSDFWFCSDGPLPRFLPFTGCLPCGIMLLYRPHDPQCVAPSDQTCAAVDVTSILCVDDWIPNSHSRVWNPIVDAKNTRNIHCSTRLI